MDVCPLMELKFGGSNSLGASLMDDASSVGGSNHNEMAASFSKLNNENIAQMINQAQLLNLNEEVSKAAAIMAQSSSGTINNMSAFSQANTASNANQNTFRQNKINFNNFHNNTAHSHTHNDSNSFIHKQRNLPFKNLRPQMHPNQNMMLTFCFVYKASDSDRVKCHSPTGLLKRIG